MEVKVAVLITNYNHQDYIEVCLESVAQQTFKEWKAFVIDDCSTDNSLAIIEKKINHDTRFTLLKNEVNIGKSKSLNKVISTPDLLDKFNYVALLDSDDYWHEDKLTQQTESIVKNQAGLVYSDGFIKDDRNGDDREWGSNKSNKRFSEIHRKPTKAEGDIFKELLAGNFIFYSTILIQTSLLKQTLFNNLIRRSMDWLFLIEIAKKASVKFVKHPLAYYRIHGDNLQNKVANTPEVTLPRKYVLAKYQDYMTANVKSRHYYAIARNLLNEKKIRSKREFLIYTYAGFLYNPISVYWLKLKLLFIKKILS